ncbi:unnamed protein product [Meganyctiphanes norvegica]|uniref:Peptidase M14 domain-containing protein n=1 Tax=Meganyctiphanes norvegica TaxID=48144 RepID=A0AAV2QIG2_MEGNR
MLAWFSVLWVATVGLVNSKELPSNYHQLRGHQVWQVSDGMDDVVQGLEAEGVVDVLDHSRSRRSLRIAPQHQEYVHNLLKDNNMDYKIHIEELLSFFQEEESAEEESRLSRRSESREQQICTADSCPQPLTDEYMTLDQMEWYLSELTDSHPDLVDVSSIGKSVEGRDIWLVHIKAGKCREEKEGKRGRRAKRMARRSMETKTLWIEGGLHAREWISPAVALRLIDNFINDCSMSETNEVYIVPMSNPDGYKYTWTTDRMWRKNRAVISNSECKGVDLNRNWDYHWGVGASKSPCSEVYQGLSAFSEPETQALRDAMKKVGDIDLVLSLHSYGQVLMYPWGWTADPAPDTEAMKKMGDIFAGGARERHGSTYEVVNSAGGFYYASGATDDWAKGKLNSKYVYTLELRDGGKHGFKLPSDQILDAGNEVWDGIKRFLNALN